MAFRMLYFPMEKIKINKISARAYTLKGFSQGAFKGCYYCPCGKDKKGGTCCQYGCDVDKESYELMVANRDKIEKAVGASLEECVPGKWIKDKEYLGGSYKRSKIRKANGFCIFHKIDGRGCELARLVIEKKLPRRLIPMICRLYPLTWEKDEVFVYDEKYAPLETGCECICQDNKTKEAIIESQKEELLDIFEIDEALLQKK